MILISDGLSYGFQRQSLENQVPCLLHTQMCQEVVERGLCFSLEQLGHCGNTDTEVVRNPLQGDFLCQIGFHIGSDLLQKGFLFLGRTQSFSAGLKCLVRRVSLLYKRIRTAKASVNRPGNGVIT